MLFCVCVALQLSFCLQSGVRLEPQHGVGSASGSLVKLTTEWQGRKQALKGRVFV